MLLKFFIDESYKAGEIFVMGGHIITEEAVANFSTEWSGILPTHGCDRKDGKRHFKMSQMSYEGRMENVPSFCEIIEKHAIALVSLKIHLQELEAAKLRLLVPGIGIDWSYYATPYRVAFTALIDMFNAREIWEVKELPPDSIVAPIFDENTEKAVILKAWEDTVAGKREHRQGYYIKPEFQDDTECLPLQGADLWAWWVRRWYEDGTPEKIDGFDIDIWKQTRTDLPKINFTYSEDELFKSLSEAARNTLKQKYGPVGCVWPILDRARWNPVVSK